MICVTLRGLQDVDEQHVLMCRRVMETMRTQSFLAGLGIAAVVTVAAAAQGTQKPAEVVVIGCLERAAQNSFALKDFRSGVSYRVTTTENIAWHVGHQLEIHGSLA